jgi:hypothetical protein
VSDPTEATYTEAVEETAETTGATEAEARDETSTSTPPPWGEDFNPERAWNTIQAQRARELELESDSKALKRLREDREAQREFLAEIGYELPDDDDDVDDTDDDDPITPVRSEVEALKAWKQQQELEQGLALFKADVDDLAREAGVDLSERDYKRVWRDAEEQASSSKKQFDRSLVASVFKELLEEREQLKRQAIEEYTNSKKAPHVPGTSKSATQVPDLDDPKERTRFMKERLRQLGDQG